MQRYRRKLLHQDSQAVAAWRGYAVPIHESFKVLSGWIPEQADSVLDQTLLWTEG